MCEPPESEVISILHTVQSTAETSCICQINDFFQRYPSSHCSILHYKKTGDSVLHIAARLDYVKLLENLLDRFGNECVDMKNNDSKTPLHEAAQFARIKSVRKLIDYGANVNAIKRSDWTSLMLACTKIKDEKTNLEMVKLLMNHGAIVNYQNKDGWSAVHLICREPAPNILQFLIANGTDLTLLTKNGRSVLHIACLHMNTDIINILLKANVDINSRDKSGNTPLHEATASGRADIIDLLLQRDADRFARNSADFTILHLAASIGNLTIVKHLITIYKYDVNATNAHQLTPLHCAGKTGNRIVYDYLKSTGAEETARDKCGRTPLNYLQGEIDHQ